MNDFDLSKITTVGECEVAISIYERLGVPVPQELLDHLEALKAPHSVNIYDYFSRTVGYSDELKKCIETTVAKLSEDGPEAKKPGLLLGKIQCGKTRAFVGIIGLAFDKGFDACVVFTKGTNALVEQTVTRLRGDFEKFIGLDKTIGKFAVDINDVMALQNGLSSSQIADQKNILVCKKEHVNVRRLLEIFRTLSPELADKKILIIDDEADFVTHNFRVKNKKALAGTVTTLIDKFVRIPKYYRYLQVTATPYSLYLQPDHVVSLSNGQVEPFRPRFTSLVPIHDKYIGGQQYYVDAQDTNSMYSHLYHRISDECFDKLLEKNKDRRLLQNVTKSDKYSDLRWAIMSYLVGSAIRKIQVYQEKQRNYLTSFLIHVSIEKDDHVWQTDLLTKLLAEWSADTSQLTALFNEVFEDMLTSIRKGRQQNLLSVPDPDKNEVWQKVKDLLEQKRYMIQPVNTDNSILPLLDTNGQLRLTHDLNIFIGGYTLDRGITIDHMIGFMYGRRPKKEQQDTVLQHCRMYGNRSKEDMAVTRLHTTANLHDIMERMDRMDEQLREWFVHYSQTNSNVDPAAVFVRLSENKQIVPCAQNRLIISDVMTLKPCKRITTYGFQTGSATSIKKTVDDIDQIILSQANYVKDDVFEIDVKVVIDILRKIRSTYIYNRPIDNNSDYEWDENEMIGCIEYATMHTNGKMLCLHRTNRNMSRIRANGNFVDAPEDGNTDTPLARAKAVTMPVIMLFRQNGSSAQQWRDAPFYWPSLMLPANLKPAVFATNM